MNVSTYLSGISQVPASSYPTLLWDFYIQHLWNYQSDSLVDRVASTCRVLAILISLPIIILGLLDISSYGIARTLGVIDDVKASTSDAATNPHVPSTRVIPSTSSPYTDSENESAVSINVNNISRNSHLPDDLCRTLDQKSLGFLEASQPRAFYASDEGSNLKLSGADLFSPAASRPSSPVLSRKSVEEGKILEHAQEQDTRLRQRVGRDAEL